MGRANWYYLVNWGHGRGWFRSARLWYYADASGAMRTGWVSDGGSWYYLGQLGAMATGWLRRALVSHSERRWRPPAMADGSGNYSTGGRLLVSGRSGFEVDLETTAKTLYSPTNYLVVVDNEPCTA